MWSLSVVVVLVVCIAFVSGLDICRLLFPGSACMETCTDGYEEKAAGLPYCSNAYTCCSPPTPTPTPPPPATEKPAERKGCGLEVLPVTGRILKDQSLFNLNTMECAWPWIVSLQLTVGDRSAHVCNGVLLSKDQFLTVKSCMENIPDGGELKVAVGICNVSNIPDSSLVALDPKTIDIANGLVLVKFATSMTTDYNLQFLPVCLPEITTELRTEFRTELQACVMASRSYGEGTVTSGRVTVLNKESCDFGSQLLTGTDQPDGTFCTSTRKDKVDACQGDEGGIVMCPDQYNRWVLKGVIDAGTCQVNDHPDKKNANNEIIDIEALTTDQMKQLQPDASD